MVLLLGSTCDEGNKLLPFELFKAALLAIPHVGIRTVTTDCAVVNTGIEAAKISDQSTYLIMLSRP